MTILVPPDPRSLFTRVLLTRSIAGLPEELLGRISLQLGIPFNRGFMLLTSYWLVGAGSYGVALDTTNVPPGRVVTNEILFTKDGTEFRLVLLYK